MSAFDNRILRVGIEINGKLQVYEGLDIKVRVTKYANPLQNEADITIAGLAQSTRDYVLTNATPFTLRRSFKRVVVWAGRQSYGAAQIYSGDIITATSTEPPNVVLNIKAKTAWALKGTMTGMSMPPVSQLSQIAQATASNMGMQLSFSASDQQVQNYAYSGSAAGQVDAISNIGGVNAYIDDSTFVVKNANASTSAFGRTLSAATGLVGKPELTDQGVKLKYMFDPKSRLGALIPLNSITNPNLNGNYICYQLTYDLCSRDVAFYCEADCRRQGWLYGLYY
jgi:hypothetical protein